MSLGLTEELELSGGEVASAKRSGPSQANEERYKLAVFAAVKDGVPVPVAVRDDARRLVMDVEADLKTFKRRLQARVDLDERWPALQAHADELTAAARAAKPEKLADRKLSSFRTAGELANAIGLLLNNSDPEVLVVTSERREAADARREANTVRNSALQVLTSTCDPAIDREQETARQRIEQLQHGIAQRRPILEIESRIATLTAEIEQIARGHLSGKWLRLAGQFAPSKIKEIARGELDQLLDQRSNVPAAVADNKRDAAAIVELQTRIGELETAKQDPERMAWHR